jgi:hypothetical protein
MLRDKLMWKKRRLPLVVIAAPLLLTLAAVSAWSGQQASASHDDCLACLQPGVRNRLVSGGWNYATYPYPQTAESGRTITIADLKGPGQINTIHFTGPMLKFFPLDHLIVMEIYFDDARTPAVSVPLGDFFADAGKRATYFTTAFVEKTPDAWTCYIPMPFKKSARITLRNDTATQIFNYSTVEWQTLPAWNDRLAYFHAAWQRLSFQLTPDTKQKIITLPGPGHLIGEYWSINTDEPAFEGMTFVMEGNKEYRVDGESEPSINYLGSEDSFNFSWGWHALFNGYKVGINHVNFKFTDNFKTVFDSKEEKVSSVSTYRFRDRDVIRFERSLEETVNWTEEFRYSPETLAVLDRIRKRNQAGGGWVDYAVTTYWYSSDPNGLGLTMPPIEERRKLVLRENPPAQ